jgi:hypothetical protein
MGNRGDWIAKCLIAATILGFLAAPDVAKADSKADLVADISTYFDECKSGSAKLSQEQCANQKAGLLSRQHALNMSDREINRKLKALDTGRGGPGNIWP